jgi:hypothetical protein
MCSAYAKPGQPFFCFRTFIDHAVIDGTTNGMPLGRRGCPSQHNKCQLSYHEKLRSPHGSAKTVGLPHLRDDDEKQRDLKKMEDNRSLLWKPRREAFLFTKTIIILIILNAFGHGGTIESLVSTGGSGGLFWTETGNRSRFIQVLHPFLFSYHRLVHLFELTNNN